MDFSGPHLVPGSQMAVQVGDELIEGTIESVHYTSAKPEIRQHPTGWRRVLRSLTPIRWRKPLPIVRPYQPAGMEVITVSERERRAKRVAENMRAALRDLGL
jgi:hypothetical protein